MKKQNIKSKFYLSLTLILVVWLFAGFVFDIVWSQIKKKEILLADINSQTSKKEEIKSLANQIQILDDRIKMTESFVLGSSQEDLVGFIETLESLSETAEVSLIVESIEIKKIDDNSLVNDFENLNLKLKAKGSFSGVTRFMDMIENLPYHTTALSSKLELVTDRLPEFIDKPVWEFDSEFTAVKKIN